MRPLTTSLFIIAPNGWRAPWSKALGLLRRPRFLQEGLRGLGELVDELHVSIVRDEVWHEALGAVDLLVFGVVEELRYRLLPGGDDVGRQALGPGEAAELVEHHVKAGFLHRRHIGEVGQA